MTECQDKIDYGHHRWVVYSTNLTDKTLMLRCVLCGAFGTVSDHTAEEWRRAWSAPSRPYIWLGGQERVTES